MKILIASAEAAPFAKAGGLADVAGALLIELNKRGIDARLIMPLYRGIKSRHQLKAVGGELTVNVGQKNIRGRLLALDDRVYFLECGELFDRKEIYGTEVGEYQDNAFRFVFYSRVLLEACDMIGFVPDVIHCNDWQAALVPLYLKTIYKGRFKSTSTLLTIHNLGYQGIFPPSAMPLTGLPFEFFNHDVMEFYGNVNFLKAGIVTADRVSTVSVNYATEILTEQNGFGLDGVLNKRADGIVGITNGIDYNEWDPATDSALAFNYSAVDLAAKKKCKDKLAAVSGFSNKTAPIMAMISRIVSQKGFDIFIAAVDNLLSLGINIVVLGKGDEGIQKKLREAGKRHQGSFSLHLEHDEPLARAIYAGADMMLIPSLYEPCGLTQLIAMRYATVPIARATGGLVDTISDYDHIKGIGTGFMFSGYNPSALEECVKRALAVHVDAKRWRALMRRCMGMDFSWDSPVDKYIRLYESMAVGGPR